MFTKFLETVLQKFFQWFKMDATKEEILEKTGHTVGLDNVSLIY